MSGIRVRSSLMAVLGLSLCVLTAGCPSSEVKPIPIPPLAQQETKPGTAVAILVDTSGSMAQPVADKEGKLRPKEEIAREALEQIIANTAQWEKNTPGRTLEMGIYSFSSSVSEVMPMQKGGAKQNSVDPGGYRSGGGDAHMSPEIGERNRA